MEMLVFLSARPWHVLSAVVVVAHRNPVYSVMSLVVTLLALAVLFVQLAGHFLGVLLILVYAGAILVLFLFVIMLLNVGSEPRGRPGAAPALGRRRRRGAVRRHPGSRCSGRRPPEAAVTEADDGPDPLARALFGEYLLLFEMAGLLLLAAVIAATVLARKADPRRREANLTAWRADLLVPALAGLLFAIGVFGALTRRNGITIFLSIELMLNSVNLALIAYSRQIAEAWVPQPGLTGHVIVLFVIAVAAAEAAVGLALFIAVYRGRRTIDVDRLNLMRW